MDSEEIKACKEFWTSAGPKPYEVLIEENLYDKFLSHLEVQKFTAEDIYRGTIRHQNMEIGDTLFYKFPTSWSLSYDQAHNFVGEFKNPVILQIKNAENIKAIFNDCNYLGEEEVIVSPMIMKVKSKLNHNSTIIFIVEII